MAGSVFGNIFKISTWGESHGEGLGVVIDGCPAGLPICEEDIQEQLDRRKPGQSKFTTPRKEDDEVHILNRFLKEDPSKGLSTVATCVDIDVMKDEE